MKRLETMAETLFLKDREGHLIFYKWGLFGEGHIVQSEVQKRRITRVVACYTVCGSLQLGVFHLLFFGDYMAFSTATMLIMTSIILTVMLYWLHISTITGPLPHSTLHLTLYHGWKNSAQELPLPFLWFSLGIMAASFFISLYIAFAVERLAFYGLLFAGLSLLGIIVHVKMIRYKRHKKH